VKELHIPFTYSLQSMNYENKNEADGPPNQPYHQLVAIQH
jgi:hypothetical protein